MLVIKDTSKISAVTSKKNNWEAYGIAFMLFHNIFTFQACWSVHSGRNCVGVSWQVDSTAVSVYRPVQATSSSTAWETSTIPTHYEADIPYTKYCFLV